MIYASPLKNDKTIDLHLYFKQISETIGFIPAQVVQRAFIRLWVEKKALLTLCRGRVFLQNSRIFSGIRTPFPIPN